MSKIIDLGKLRFHYAGEFSPSTVYEANDVVKYGGNIYVYIYGLKTSGNLPTNTTYWSLMVKGIDFRGVYSPSTAYKIGDGVAHGGKVYVAIADTTGNIPPNLTYWSQFADGIQWEGAYNNTRPYQKNDVVNYGGNVYIAKSDTTGNLPSDGTYWETFSSGFTNKALYNPATAYAKNDIVKYGPNYYIAKGDTTGNLPSNVTYWDILIEGLKVDQTFTLGESYVKNDVVRYGPNYYIAKGDTTGNLPTDTTYFDTWIEGVKFQNTYSDSTTYYLNDIVVYGGSVYRAKMETVGNRPTDQTKFEKIVSGLKFRAAWATTTDYFPDEVVTFSGNVYVANERHTAGTFATDLAANKWTKVSSGLKSKGGWQQSTAYAEGDIVTDAGSSYIAVDFHTSGTGLFSDDSAHWAQLALGGDFATILQTWVSKTANYTAVNRDQVFADGTFTITLPATPAVGDYVTVVVKSGLITIDGGTNALDLGPTTTKLIPGVTAKYVYSGASGWINTNKVNAFTRAKAFFFSSF